MHQMSIKLIIRSLITVMTKKDDYQVNDKLLDIDHNLLVLLEHDDFRWPSCYVMSLVCRLLLFQRGFIWIVAKGHLRSEVWGKRQAMKDPTTELSSLHGLTATYVISHLLPADDFPSGLQTILSAAVKPPVKHGHVLNWRFCQSSRLYIHFAVDVNLTTWRATYTNKLLLSNLISTIKTDDKSIGKGSKHININDHFTGLFS